MRADEAADRARRETVATESAVREIVGSPSELVRRKQLALLDAHARAFIALSPMVIIASADAEGHADASPRGDPAGFVRVLDDRTLLVPDRKGNRRVDTFLNVMSNPRVGLLFLVPGTAETLRVNGRASISSDADVLADCAVDGKAPKLGMLVEVEEVFFHCARSFLRAQLWKPDTWPDRSALPTLGTIIADQVRVKGQTATVIDDDLEQSNRDLY